MASINTKAKTPAHTHEGAPAVPDRRPLETLLNCTLLWEDTFYVDGYSIAERIDSEVMVTDFQEVCRTIINSVEKHNLRHAPLLALATLPHHPQWSKFSSDDLHARAFNTVVGARADQITELLALWWRGGRRSAPNQWKKLAGPALAKFDAYQLAKWRAPKATVKLKDALRFLHPVPPSPEHSKLWDLLLKDELPTPNTWETRLSAGEDKLTVFSELLKERKLGALAAVRNLRNMQEAGIPTTTINAYLKDCNFSRLLPYQIMKAGIVAPWAQPVLDAKMATMIPDEEKLPGNTLILVDTSYSVYGMLANRCDLNVAALASHALSMCSDAHMVAFSTKASYVPPRYGFALRDYLENSCDHNGTSVGPAFKLAQSYGPFDRYIVITDMQLADTLPSPVKGRSYVINVANYKNSCAFGGWTQINGFSASTMRFIRAMES